MNVNTIAVASQRPALPARNQKIRRLIEDPILTTLLKLAAPNLADASARVAFLTLDAYFVSFLGGDALAGVALVFPFFLLMQTMATAAMGGGVSSAVARALGAGNQDDANALVWHGAAIALGMSAAFLLVFLIGGPALYRAMGAKGHVLEAAISYSRIVFAGGIFVWLMNILANVVRGTGAMAVSAGAIVIAEIAHVACAPILILGLAGAPSLGVAGAGLGVILSYAAGTIALVIYLASNYAAVHFVRPKFEWRLFAAILRVGALSSVNILQNQATYIVLGILVTVFGGVALAGFGAAVRVEYSMMALVFTVGAATVTMIGANIGAGQTQRAIRVAWTGAAISGIIAGTVGIVAALFAQHWMELFTADPAIKAVGANYLTICGPAYALLGIGGGLFYASQGFGSVTEPFLAQTSRLVLLVIAGWVVMPMFGLGLRGLFIANAATITWVGGAIAFIFWWLSRRRLQK
jgi:putative MATE family efflux protein